MDEKTKIKGNLDVDKPNNSKKEESEKETKKVVEEKFDDWHNWEDQVVSMGR